MRTYALKWREDGEYLVQMGPGSDVLWSRTGTPLHLERHEAFALQRTWGKDEVAVVRIKDA